MFTICVHICSRCTFALGLQEAKGRRMWRSCMWPHKTKQHFAKTRNGTVLQMFTDGVCREGCPHVFWGPIRWHWFLNTFERLKSETLNSFSKHPFWFSRFSKLNKSRVFGLRREVQKWVTSLKSGEMCCFWKWKFEKACCFFREQMGIRTNGNLEVVFVTLGPKMGSHLFERVLYDRIPMLTHEN